MVDVKISITDDQLSEALEQFFRLPRVQQRQKKCWKVIRANTKGNKDEEVSSPKLLVSPVSDADRLEAQEPKRPVVDETPPMVEDVPLVVMNDKDARGTSSISVSDKDAIFYNYGRHKWENITKDDMNNWIHSYPLKDVAKGIRIGGKQLDIRGKDNQPEDFKVFIESCLESSPKNER